MKGFTLTELLTVVAIMGILLAIGIPQYIGYKQTANDTSVKNNLRAIYMQQQEYYLNNNAYYITGAACGDGAANINTNLFDSKTVIPDTTTGFQYCILQVTTQDFTARAEETSSARVFTINEDNNTNF